MTGSQLFRKLRDFAIELSEGVNLDFTIILPAPAAYELFQDAAAAGQVGLKVNPDKGTFPWYKLDFGDDVTVTVRSDANGTMTKQGPDKETET